VLQVGRGHLQGDKSGCGWSRGHRRSSRICDILFLKLGGLCQMTVKKKRERESLFCFQNSNRSNSPAMMATYSSSPHRDWAMAAVCCWQVIFTVRVDLPQCPCFQGVFPEVWTWGRICSLQRIFYCSGFEQFSTRRSRL